MNTIKDVLNSFKPRIEEIRRNPTGQKWREFDDEFENAIKNIANAENEIAEYYEKAMITGDWEYELFWAMAALMYPSSTYLDIFFKILSTVNASYPHWRIMDILAYMPEELNLIITKRLQETIKLDNPSWGEDELKKAFEVLVWIGEDEGVEFIEEQQQSDNVRIAQMAKYWVERLNDDDDEE